MFLRLGTTAFGGPAAHVAMMEDEFVRRRRWLTHDRFLDMLGAVNLIPGPSSTEMAIYVGYLQAGWMGLILAGVCFIFPAMAIVTAIAWAYVHYGSLPQMAGPLYGVKPVVIAIILQAIWGLGRRAVKTRLLAAVAILAIGANLLGLDPISLLLAAGLTVALGHGLSHDRSKAWRPMLAMTLVVCAILALIQIAPRIQVSGESQFGLGSLFLYFVKVGSVLYGTGYVLLAFLEGDLVHRWGWLSATQLLDATAVGQVTPGPLFTTATFIGYLLGGLPGALVATVGIFLPSFFFIAIGGPLFPRLRKSALAGALLDGVNVAALALMAVVSLRLGGEAIVDWTTATAAIVSGILLIRFRIASAWLVLGGAILGFAAQAIQAGG